MSLSSSNLRAILAAVLFASVVFAPAWLVLILAAALAARWRAGEVIVAGILYDLLWLPAHIVFSSLAGLPLATIIAIALVFAFEPMRRQLLV